MKTSILTATFLSALCGLLCAGTYSDKKQVAPEPCPEWYGDNEWNISLWGTYAFTGTEDAPNPDLLDIVQSASEGSPVYGTFDRYLGDDHAWGGGIDAKYFFHRYFGIGVEGFLLNAKRHGFELESDGEDIFIADKTTEHRAIGAVLGTLTLRYPLQCSRLAPYAWIGGGAIFGGGERDRIVFDGFGPGNAGEGGGGEPEEDLFHTVHTGSTTEPMGQFGFGLEVRITRHIGWKTDYSWNMIDGPENNFGMLRAGINFAF
jgi:hypothetical protein